MDQDQARVLNEELRRLIGSGAENRLDNDGVILLYPENIPDRGLEGNIRGNEHQCERQQNRNIAALRQYFPPVIQGSQREKAQDDSLPGLGIIQYIEQIIGKRIQAEDQRLERRFQFVNFFDQSRLQQRNVCNKNVINPVKSSMPVL